MAAAPQPIDPRGPRFNQAVLAAALVVGFVLDWRAVIPLFAVVLLLGAAFGPRHGPFLRLYAEVIKPRLAPPAELEDPRPPRFAQAVGLGFTVVALVGYLTGAVLLAQVAVGLAVVAAFLNAAFGFCLGCELYLRGIRVLRPVP